MPGRVLKSFQHLSTIIVPLIFSLILPACAGDGIGSLIDGGDDSLYLPPTPAIALGTGIKPTAITTASVTPRPIKTPATPTPACTYNLQFIEDLTIPDGTVISPGAIMDKRWQVENTGTCNWGEDLRLRLISGQELGATSEQALYPARSGTVATIRIIFNAHDIAGAYHSAWQAVNPRGELFGDPIYIDFIVETQDMNS